MGLLDDLWDAGGIFKEGLERATDVSTYPQVIKGLLSGDYSQVPPLTKFEDRVPEGLSQFFSQSPEEQVMSFMPLPMAYQVHAKPRMTDLGKIIDISAFESESPLDFVKFSRELARNVKEGNYVGVGSDPLISNKVRYGGKEAASMDDIIKSMGGYYTDDIGQTFLPSEDILGLLNNTTKRNEFFDKARNVKRNTYEGYNNYIDRSSGSNERYFNWFDEPWEKNLTRQLSEGQFSEKPVSSSGAIATSEGIPIWGRRREQLEAGLISPEEAQILAAQDRERFIRTGGRRVAGEHLNFIDNFNLKFNR